MSAQYDLYETPDIKQTGEKQPLHPRIVPKGTIGQDEFLDRVHKFTGISRSLLAGAMQSFQNEFEGSPAPHRPGTACTRRRRRL